MLLLIDNYDSFTWNLVHRVCEVLPSLRIDQDLRVVRNDAISPDEVEVIDAGRPPGAIIISPGPCTPEEAGISPALIERFAGRVPILGVCLGHQCIGAVGGMRVIRHERPVHGKTSLIEHDGLGLFEGLDSPFEAMRYHSLVVAAESVPGSLAALAPEWEVSAWTTDLLPSGQSVRVVMGLRRQWNVPNAPPLEGLQFHPESFMTSVGHSILANFLRQTPFGAALPESRLRNPGYPCDR
ncbi:MAG: aminodeoxychorismate/anthranilate synthase component II [Phycisphaeraceae bacterium]|nr:aminodeoxychorismate/anthranilate synthase component II [Phycisphaeraceae bacterium]